METNKKGQTKTNVLFASPYFLTTLLPLMENTFFIFFLTNVAMLSTAAMTTVTSIGSTFIAFSALVSGVIMQKVSFKKGKYRPWLLYAPVGVIIGRFMQFTAFDGMSEGAMIVWFIVGYVLCNFAYSFTSTSYNALIPTIAKAPNDRVQVSSFMFVFSSAAQLVFSATVVALIASIGSSSPALGYSVIGNITGVLVLLGCIALFFITKKVPDGVVDASESEKSVVDNSKVSIWEMLKYTFANKCTILFLLAMWGKTASSIVVAFTAAYYYTYVAGNMALLTIYLTASTFVQIGGAFITPLFSKLVKGPRNAYGFSLIAYALILFLAFLMKENVLVVTILLSINQAFWAIYLSSEMPLFIGVIDYTENKTGKDLRAFMMSVQTFSIKFAIIIATTTVGLGLQSIGFEAAAVTDSAISGIPIVVMIIPAIYAAIAAVITFFIPLPDAKMIQYREENEARKAAQQQ